MPKLLEQVRDQMRTRHYGYRTGQRYVHWIKQFITFLGKDICLEYFFDEAIRLDKLFQTVIV